MRTAIAIATLSIAVAIIGEPRPVALGIALLGGVTAAASIYLERSTR